VNIFLEKLVEDVPLGDKQVEQVLDFGRAALVILLLRHNVLTQALLKFELKFQRPDKESQIDIL
jgi:hypothetical protein